MAQDSMNISLPAEMTAWVEQQIRLGRYGDASEYVRDLIRKDQVRAVKVARMQTLVDDARASGISTNSMDEIRAEARRQAGIDA